MEEEREKDRVREREREQKRNMIKRIGQDMRKSVKAFMIRLLMQCLKIAPNI